MEAFEVLRAAAEIIRTEGWSQGHAARDRNGFPVRLFQADAKDGVNPAAASFSMYGAIVKAQHGYRASIGPAAWDLLFRRAQEKLPAVHGIHPTLDLNEHPGQTAAEVITFLQACADELEAGHRVAPPIKLPNPVLIDLTAAAVVDSQRMATPVPPLLLNPFEEGEA